MLLSLPLNIRTSLLRHLKPHFHPPFYQWAYAFFIRLATCSFRSVSYHFTIAQPHWQYTGWDIHNNFKFIWLRFLLKVHNSSVGPLYVVSEQNWLPILLKPLPPKSNLGHLLFLMESTPHCEVNYEDSSVSAKAGQLWAELHTVYIGCRPHNVSYTPENNRFVMSFNS